MLKSYKQDISDVALVFTHVGTKEDKGNRVYAIAAAILSINVPLRTFDSLVRYPYVTARERYYSNVSRESLADAPESSAVFTQLRAFLKDCPFILTLPYRDNYEDVSKICSDKRIIDLSFAVEFFLPQIDSFSAKRLWEYLHNRERSRIYFTAPEAVELSMELIRHICGNELNDVVFPRAAATRYFLGKSNTLLGSLFLHLARNYGKYFDALLKPCQSPDTPKWNAFLETATAKPPENKNSDSFRKIDVARMEMIYRGFSQSIKGFTFRPSQVEYAQHIARTINDGEVLTIEAGTGTGKTQGYLVPVMEFLYRNSDARVAISTYTKSLQDQIFKQEIPFIQDAIKMYQLIPVSLLKGKSNYICAEKLDSVYDEAWQGRMLLIWLYFVNLTYHFREADGERLGQRVSHYLNDGPFFYQFQREVSARSGCGPKHIRCPAQVVTAEARKARLIVTNHHKLALLNQDTILSGLFKITVIDEANHFEQAVRSAFSDEFNSRETTGFVEYLESVLTKAQGRAAGETEDTIKKALAALADLRSEMNRFGEILKEIRIRTKPGGGHTELPASSAVFKEGNVRAHLEALRDAIRRIADNLNWLKDDDICRLLKMQERTRERMKRILADLLEQDMSLKITAEAHGTPNRIAMYDLFVRHWVLVSQSVDVSTLIRENFYRDTKGLVYTSATICMDGSYETFKKIVGMDRPFFLDKDAAKSKEFRYASLESFFSAARMEMIVPHEAVRGDYTNKSIWTNSVVKILPELIKKNRGRTLVLFSSYQDLETVAKRIGDEITEAGFPLLIQRSGHSTADLCDEFRAVKESVLFGVDTFWYGVDFKGDTLTQVIITRIPYPSPQDPIQMARKNTLRLSEYGDRYLYDTHIKMKQGIGRLIRCESDHGKVIVLDSRYLLQREKMSPPSQNKEDSLRDKEITKHIGPCLSAPEPQVRNYALKAVLSSRCHYVIDHVEKIGKTEDQEYNIALCERILTKL
jgi:ATP-dependent DNA helicase DinG